MPTFAMTEPPRLKVLRIGRRTKVHTSRSLRGGTTNLGTLSLMVRRAAAGGAMASAAAAAATKTKERWRTLGMDPPGVANSHRSRQTRAVNGARVPALALAPAVERGVALREDLRGEEGHVPAVGMARHEPEETLLPLPADPETQPGLHRPRLAERVLEAELPTRERDALAVEEGAQGLRRLLHLVEPLLDRRERNAEGARLDLVPYRADAEFAAPAAQVIDGDRGLRE